MNLAIGIAIGIFILLWIWIVFEIKNAPEYDKNGMPIKKDSIDIKDYLIEILLVEVPFKKLCSTDCKGICIKCGSNRNDESCLCEKNK